MLRFFDKHGLAATRDAFGVSRRTLHPNKVKAQALEVLACSTRERSRLRHAPRHRHFIDPVSHFAFAVGLPSQHARYTARALEQGPSLLPQRPTAVRSDNGSEFKADVAQLLEAARHPALVHLPQDAQDERQTRA